LKDFQTNYHPNKGEQSHKSFAPLFDTPRQLEHAKQNKNPSYDITKKDQQGKCRSENSILNIVQPNSCVRPSHERKSPIECINETPQEEKKRQSVQQLDLGRHSCVWHSAVENPVEQPERNEQRKELHGSSKTFRPWACGTREMFLASPVS